MATYSLDTPIREDAVRFVCVSDTHTRFGEMVEENLIPAGDVLLHCGDITHAGRKEDYIEFNEQLGTLFEVYGGDSHRTTRSKGQDYMTTLSF